ncbi:cytochrome P450 [Schizophyllum amplum]|uniref:Cytochrome P450 n=1 Tax=Schizophyllum amplum TaxID=97359 RepID=A0A550BX81_9AGAR|nr:cytochrome P450 [Auriculariopsis ampla]
MAFSSTTIQLAVAITIAVVFALYVRRRRSVLAGLAGPESSHPILGFLTTLLRGSEAGEVDFALQNKYGGAVRFDSIFGMQQLWLCDPKAVQYIAQTAGYKFIRASDRKEDSRLTVGDGVATVEGDDHRRHRRIMLPGFGAKESRTSLCALLLSQGKTGKSYRTRGSRQKFNVVQMADKWVQIIQDEENATIDAPFWISRATLDALGEAALDYQFNALDDMSNELARAFSGLFAKARLNPSNWSIFEEYVVPLLPLTLVRTWNAYVPSKKRAIQHHCKTISEDVARQLVQEKSAALLADKGGHDIMSLLVKANASAGAKGGMAEDEMLAQLSTIIIAGHETTANSICWTLLELCRNPDVQTRLRNEIRAVRRERNEPGLTAATFDAMPYLSAVMKESLRYHTGLYHIAKEAAQDEVIPLLRPVVGTDGKMIHEIPVQKGQNVILSVAAYNRDKDVFGQDAHTFNPERWLEDGYITKQAFVGVYANLLTFGGGHRACLGWRFAILELSTFLVELVDKFEFAIDPEVKILRGAAIIMPPIIEGEEAKGTQLPLRVRLAPPMD